MANRNLRVYSPLIQTGFALEYLDDVSERAVGWSRTIHRDAGYLDGEFIIPGSDLSLQRMMGEYIGAHFEERSSGVKTWEGLIYEMDLAKSGTIYRISLDLLANHVTAKYIDEDNVIQDTSAAENTDSQEKYGRKEELLLLDGFKQAEAESRRDSFLATYGFPQPFTMSFSADRPDGLEVKVLGYVHTAAWRYETVGDASEGAISTYLTELITTDCEFLKTGRITENTAQHVKTSNLPMRVFDVFRELTDVGIGSVPARLYVTNGRRVNYEPLDLNPEYYTRNGVFYTSAGGSAEADRWRVTPGVVRNMSYPFAKRHKNSIFQDARDAYLVEVEAGDAGLYPKTEVFDEGEFYASENRWKKALAQLKQRQEERAEHRETVL